ncbi:MAG: hypothetical protein KIT87_16130 [Anaerolineae bacterium]|nr:hypothetical protein [Anaerolineae bacterium]
MTAERPPLPPAPVGQDIHILGRYIRAALDLGYTLEEIRDAYPRLTSDQLYLAYRHALKIARVGRVGGNRE